jgi:RAD51-like protein 2
MYEDDSNFTFARGFTSSELDTLTQLSQSTIRRLRDSGFQSFDDFNGQTALNLSKECSISQKDALIVLQQVRKSTSVNNSSHHQVKSALQAFQQHQDRKSIITFCREVDTLLSGGIPLRQTSEVCGVPGAGKTQLSLQLAVNVQLPEILEGCGGECLYIDTEGSFMVERLEQIATSFVKHIHKMASQKDKETRKIVEKITVESVLKNVRYFRLYNLLEQLAYVHNLETYLQQHKNIKLIIFDSITFHFRHDQQGYGDHMQRNKLLQSMSQKMSQLANDYNLAVVYLNQVTTRVDKNDPSNTALAPALGMTWGNACSNHFFLEVDTVTGDRYFRVNKGITMQPGKVKYAITPDGFRGVNRRVISLDEHSQQQQDSLSSNSRKRPREN